MMHEGGKSDSPIVPEKPPNKAAEAVEGRGLAKGSLPKRNASRTLSRIDVQSALRRVRHAARRDRKQRFTALLHHVYDVERLRAAYMALRREAAAGVDGETWRHLRRGTGGEPPRPFRAAQARSVPGEAGSSGVHPEGGRAAEAARGACAGR